MDEKVRGFEFWASEQAAGRGSVSETHYTANEASQRASSKPAEWITGEYQSRFVIERKATVAGTRDASRAAWLSEIREPDWYRDSSLALSDQPQKAPSCNLSMEWVHGFRSRGYDGVKYTKDGDLAFFAGATAVVQQAPAPKMGALLSKCFIPGTMAVTFSALLYPPMEGQQLRAAWRETESDSLGPHVRHNSQGH